MITEFLTPVSDELRQFTTTLDIFSIGSNIVFENSVEENSIVLLGVKKKNTDDYLEPPTNQLRKEFYRLKKGNWHFKLYDLGDLLPGATSEDTYFAFLEIQREILKKNCILIIIGDDSALTYWQFRAFDYISHKVNLSCIDNRFRLDNDTDELSGLNYLSKIITTDPHSLFDYTHLGYQTYFVAQEELDLMEELNFDVKRLGLLTENIEESEPELRNSDMVVLNLESIQSHDFQSTYELSPNGFNSREICALSRYSGVNNKVKSFGVYNFKAKNKLSDNLLVAEIIWYFIEGKNHVAEEFDIDNIKSYEAFRVQSPEQELIFYRNIYSDQWWLDLNDSESPENKKQLIPCSLKDYKDSLQGKIPQRWWKAYKKLY